MSAMQCGWRYPMHVSRTRSPKHRPAVPVHSAHPRSGGPCIVKICGVTNPEDAAVAAKAGADYIGMIMWQKAKRAVSAETARQIADVAKQHGAEPVGVFVDEPAQEIINRCRDSGITFAQLHGDAARAGLQELQGSGLCIVYVMHSTPDGQIVTPLPPAETVDWLLIDGLKGGSGEALDWKALQPPTGIARKGWLLAGGLTPDNVHTAVHPAKPTGVDVSSGVCGPDVMAQAMADEPLAILDSLAMFKQENLGLDTALMAPGPNGQSAQDNIASSGQMAGPGGQQHGESSGSRLASLRPSSADSKEEVLRFLGRALVLQAVDGRYRAPVVTLHNSDTSNLYSLLERQLRTEYLVGAEKFWKIVRLDQQLDTWRPRVHGTQLKALLNCRLPEQPDEYVAAEKSIQSIKWALRSDTSPENFIAELKKFVAGVEVWWDHRNSRRPPADSSASGSLKRPAANALSAPQAKQQQVAAQQMQPPMQLPGQTGPGLRKSAGGRSQPDAMVSSSPMYGQQGGLMRMHGSYSENGLGSRESPEDLPFAPNGTDLQHFMSGRPGGMQPLPPLPSPSEPNAVVHLNVGGSTHSTTVATLTCVPGCLFWELLTPGSSGLGEPTRTATGELFLDRNGKVFSYILEYLRATANKEPYFPLPEDAQELASLAREAEYFGLPGLCERIRNMSIMPQPTTHAVYDSIYLETGFNSIEGPSLKEMEQRKVVVMQQMNHVLAQKAMDGFFVAACDCGVNHREGPDGMQHNLFYHILLKKVMPVQPGMGPGAGMHPAAAAAAQMAALHQQHAMAMGQSPGGMPMQMGMPMHGQMPGPPGPR